MYDVLSMFNTMTVWAKNDKIFYPVIFSVLVYMMNTKNFRMKIIFAIFTLSNLSSYLKTLSDSAIRRFPCFHFTFCNTRSGTIFPIFISFVIYKFFSTMNTIKFRKRFDFPKIVTFGRAVFRCVLTIKNYFVSFITKLTGIFQVHGRIFGMAQARTKFSLVSSIKRNVKLSFAFQTINIFTIMRFCHATP